MIEYTPFLAFESLEYLSSLLKPNWNLLETGSGNSTIWFSRRVKKVVSFEHSKEWYIEEKKMIDDNKIKNIDLRLEPDYPIKGISGFKNGEFDFISIDGRGRVKSVETILPYLKSGGYLLLDDSQREKYQSIIILLNDWENKTLGRRRKQATIWRKP